MSPRSKRSLRPLTPQEADLLRWILEHGSEDTRSFLPQIDGMRANSSCDCGCWSIRLEPSAPAPLGANRGERIIGEFVGVTVGGDSIGLIVFQDGGRLSELEVYPYVDFGSKSPEANFPNIESLEPN